MITKKTISCLTSIVMIFSMLCFFPFKVINNIEVKAANNETVIWPVPGYNKITSRFGWRDLNGDGVNEDHHQAIDIGCPIGTNVLAVASGKVALVQNDSQNYGMGRRIVIYHGNSIYTGYQHLSEILVKEGDTVSQGDVIAHSGNSGGNYAAHLDFHVKMNSGDDIGSVTNHFNKDPLDNFLPYVGSVSTNGETVYIDSKAYTFETIIQDKWTTETAGQYTTKDVTTNLNIRSSPSTSASIVGKVPAGSTVNVTKTNETWAYIEYNGTTGYCSLDYLQKALQKPSAPVASLSKITTNSATITWNSVSGATSYKITFRKSGDEYQTIEENYTDTSYTKTGLSPNTQYYFRVYAVNAAGESDRSETVSAKTNQASFKVTFNANGGTTPTESKSVTNGSKYGTLPDPKYEGHSFNGWFTEKSGGTKITADTVANLSAEQTLYAHWTINTISFTYNTNGGTVMEGSPNYYADKDGYMYKVGDTEKIVGKKDYNSSSSSSGLYDGATFDLYRIGYSFIGWSTKKSGGTLIKDNEIVKFDKNIYPDIETKSGNVVFYAQWKPLETVGLYYYENDSQINYLLGSDLNNIDNIITPKSEGSSVITVDKDNEYKKEPILNVSVLTTEDSFSTKSSLSGSALSGSYPEDKTVYLSFYAKAGMLNSNVSVRFSGDDQYTSTALTTSWKYYVLEMHKVPVSNAWLHWKFDTIGAYELSHIMLSDKKPVEGDFVASSETDTVKVDKNFKQGSPYGKLYIPERKGYKFIGWFTDNSSESKQITADTIAEANMGVFAHWKLIGDVNDDNEFNIADAVVLQRWLLGKAELVDWQVADLCEDGKLDVFDLCLMKELLIQDGAL